MGRPAEPLVPPGVDKGQISRTLCRAASVNAPLVAAKDGRLNAASVCMRIHVRRGIKVRRHLCAGSEFVHWLARASENVSERVRSTSGGSSSKPHTER